MIRSPRWPRPVKWRLPASAKRRGLARSAVRRGARAAGRDAANTLFVCEGNIGRSPFAHQFAKQFAVPGRAIVSGPANSTIAEQNSRSVDY